MYPMPKPRVHWAHGSIVLVLCRGMGLFLPRGNALRAGGPSQRIIDSSGAIHLWLSVSRAPEDIEEYAGIRCLWLVHLRVIIWSAKLHGLYLIRLFWLWISEYSRFSPEEPFCSIRAWIASLSLRYRTAWIVIGDISIQMAYCIGQVLLSNTRVPTITRHSWRSNKKDAIRFNVDHGGPAS